MFDGEFAYANRLGKKISESFGYRIRGFLLFNNLHYTHTHTIISPETRKHIRSHTRKCARSRLQTSAHSFTWTNTHRHMDTHAHIHACLRINGSQFSLKRCHTPANNTHTLTAHTHTHTPSGTHTRRTNVRSRRRRKTRKPTRTRAHTPTYEIRRHVPWHCQFLWLMRSHHGWLVLTPYIRKYPFSPPRPPSRILPPPDAHCRWAWRMRCHSAGLDPLSANSDRPATRTPRLVAGSGEGGGPFARRRK